MLRKTTMLKVVNGLLFLSLIIQGGSGLFRLHLPHELFEWMHERNGIVLLILAVLHLVLNWNWVKTSYFK